EKIDPNPHQPRSEMGDIQELMNSIREKGILEPILVRPKGERYEIIAGERRYQAARRLRMTEMPCIEKDVDDREAMELSLIENLQRKDLDAFEEADGLKALMEIYGYTHEKISDKLGKARSTITEVISISKIPFLARKRCQETGITSRSQLLEISKLRNEQDMLSVIEEISSRGLRRSDTRDLTKDFKGVKKLKKKSRFVFLYKPPEGDQYRMKLELKKGTANKEEIIQILQQIIENLRARAK
ncbi:MAG: ParB/RepB/Spo0J family partition protein, partial [Candidatus Aminicenantes bacterium]|nr:ParB/RepB/Spo0J family partition protein [Candidatus Aminicenantes bacterium]